MIFELDVSGVYGLVDSRRPHKIKYVGGTNKQTVRNRLQQHLSKRASPRIFDWASEVIQAGATVEAVVLEPGLTGPELRKAEQQWIAWAKLFGPTLNNERGDLNGKNRYNKEFV
jgi:hypothetical protein